MMGTHSRECPHTAWGGLVLREWRICGQRGQFMTYVEHLYCRQVPAKVWNLMTGGLRMRSGEG